ncbi:MAG: guanylate kinase [Candidatus Berkelbacteria bacterium]|nr:guanylate kinase [Candidatus Berkelbacteria bacterium]
MLQSNQLILIISGVAGAGKRSVAEILHQNPDKFVFSVSYTDRLPRPDETSGVEYKFVTESEFDRMVEAEEFLEWEPIHHNRYGTKKADFENLFTTGKVVVSELDVKGMTKLRAIYPDQIVSVFVIPPSLEIAHERLTQRGTEDEADRAKRKERYSFEIAYKDQYDHIIINDKLDRARDELLEIIEGKLEKGKSGE